MKFKIIIYLFIFCISVVFNSKSDEIKFESSELNILENGNVITAKKGKAIIPDEKMIIEGDFSTYNKSDSELIVIDNVKLFDWKKDIYLETEKLVYNKSNNIIYTKGKTFVDIEDIYKINTKDLVYDRNEMDIFSDKETIVEDNLNNIFNLEESFIFDITNEIITSKKSNVVDENNNIHHFENVRINLVTNEIVGKEYKIVFNDSFFGSPANDPLLKGRSVTSDNDITRVHKAVFSTCNMENKKCRGWELESNVFDHDKKEKLFIYKQSWLKIFGQRVLFFPYFSHPDPSVKRTSGFLTPIYLNSSVLGRSLDIPYFQVISKDKDMTFNPRLYSNQNFIAQAEYRQQFKNSFFISDFSINSENEKADTSIFANLSGEIENDYEHNTVYDIHFQDVSNDNYLKRHNLAARSPIITSESVLTSSINVSQMFDDGASLTTSTKIFEDLSKESSDRYQYVFPEFNFKKGIKIDENYNGKFNFTSTGFQKVYETNKYQAVINNDFLYESFDYISGSGLLTDYDILLKNFNDYADNTTNTETKFNNFVHGSAIFKTSFPLRKKKENSVSYLKPIFSARYSPNNTDDISGKDFRLTYNNIFSLNRIGTNDMVEGGKSVSLGVEYETVNFKNDDRYRIKVANNFREKKKLSLPSKSKLDQTRSDLVGNFSYIPNKYLNFDYQFSFDRDLDHSNYDSISTSLITDYFGTTFNYVTENHEGGDSEVMRNTTGINFNDENRITFNTSRDLKTDFTEYYNLVYTYETDCLSASFFYNKKFYRNGDLVPEETLQFLIRFIPFTEIRGSADTFVKNIGNKE